MLGTYSQLLLDIEKDQIGQKGKGLIYGDHRLGDAMTTTSK